MSHAPTIATQLPEVLHWPVDFGDHSGPPPIYARLRAERPVQRLMVPSGHVMYLLTRRDDIVSVVTDKRFSRDQTHADAPQLIPNNVTSLPGSIFNVDGADHSRIRAVLQGLFTRGAIDAHRAMIQQKTQEHLDAVDIEPQPVDLVESLAIPLSIDVSAAFLGYQVADRIDLVRQFQQQTDLSLDPDGMAAANDAVFELAKRVIAEKSDKPDPDNPIGALVIAHCDGKISKQEMYGTAHLLLMTTTDPVTGPLCAGIISLIINKLVPELLANPQLWPKAVEEVLRKHHNGYLSFPRIALEDVEISGTLIRQGEAVITPYIAATNDPDHYTDPDRFDIHRKTDGTLTFGHGPHFCLGSNLARLFLNVVLPTLFTRFPTLELALPPDEIPWHDEVIITRPYQLPVVW